MCSVTGKFERVDDAATAQIQRVIFGKENCSFFRKNIHACKLGARNPEMDFLIPAESRKHAKMVPMVMSNRNKQIPVAGPFVHDCAEGLFGSAVPTDGIGKIDKQGFVRSNHEVHIRAVV